VNFGERPFEFEFQTDQLVWARRSSSATCRTTLRTGARASCRSATRPYLFGSTLASYRLTGSAARQRWRFVRRIVVTPPETERMSHELTEYCVDAAGELYALAHVRHEPLMVLKLVLAADVHDDVAHGGSEAVDADVARLLGC
jgi:hypothetical protein